MAETPAYVVVDHILKAENEQITEQNTFNISFTELVEGDKEAIGDWIIDNLNYSEIHGAPALPIDENEASDAYNTVNNERVIKPLQEVAFTADYDDLTNAPIIPDINGSRPTEFDQIAFTGQINMDNSGLKIAKIFDLTQYQLWDINNKPASFNTDVQNLHALGSETISIKGFNTGSYGQILASDIGALVTAFNNQSSIDYQRPTFIKSDTGLFQIIKAQLFRDGPDTVYYKIDTILIPDNTYNYNPDSLLDPQVNNGLIYVTDEQANIILDNLAMDDPSLISFVFDMVHCLILCKLNILSASEEIDPIFTASPAANITNQDIINWNSKPNTDEILNILDLKNYSASIDGMTTEQNTTNNSKLQNIGTNSSYVLGLNLFIDNITNETLIDNINNFITEYFKQQKSSYIISNYRTFLVTNISITNDENTNEPIYYQISLTNSSLLNYSNIREIQSNITAEQANNVLSNLYNSANYINSLIIDIENNIIYFNQNNSIIKYNQLFNLEDFANTIQDETNKNKVLNLGIEDTYILNADQIIINEQYSLINELNGFARTYNSIGRASYLIANNILLPITNVSIYTNYVQIDLKLSNIINYDIIKPNTINSTNAQTVLTNLNIKNNQSIIILDLEQKVIYCKIKEEQN